LDNKIQSEIGVYSISNMRMALLGKLLKKPSYLFTFPSIKML